MLLLSFNSYDILARSGSALPVPLDSVVLDGALGGFATAGGNQIYYGSGAYAELHIFIDVVKWNTSLLSVMSALD